MARLLPHAVAVAALMTVTAPTAEAATRIGVAPGTGAAAGEAIRITGDRFANDITITRPQTTVKGRTRASFKIVDRRAAVRVDEQARRRNGCRVRSRHTVVCATPVTPYVYAHLGAGKDRFTVRSVRAPGFPAPPVAAPDGLAGFPQDEGSEGSFLGWIIDGGPGDDRISGSPYFDHIIGGAGSDVLLGRDGDDLFEQRQVRRRDNDTIVGGAGHDALTWNANTPLNIDLRSGTFNGGTVGSIDKVRGGGADDVLVGSDVPELLQGGQGSDAITGNGGADLLIGDGLYILLPLADRIDAGAGDDLVDISNREYQPFGPAVAQSPPGPSDSVVCGDGNDRVDSPVSTQLVPADCEGQRFNDAATTMPLRPARRADGALVYDVPCPAQRFYPSPIGVCDGTLTLTDPANSSVLGTAAFSAKGGARVAVAVKPAGPLPNGPVGVRIAGAFDHAPANDTLNGFDFGWATAP